MSLAKKEEVCSHRLVPRLGEPAVGVPIKKRPVLLSDRSVASSMPLSIKPPSPVKDMPVSATGAGCGHESFFNIAKSDTNVITKGKGITDTQIQDHANRSFTSLSMTSGHGGLFNASSEIPSAESAARRFPPVVESQRQNFLALDLQLPSRQNGKDSNYGSIVKEEKVDQALSGLSSAEAHNNVHVASELNASSYSNSSDGRLPNLDLNVPLDPADSLEGLPTMHESGNGLFHHRTIQRQKAQVAPAAPISTTSNGVGQNVGSTVNMSNSFGLSHKCGPADVTLDLQLKPPTRPELGINWKGLVPAPELSLSLFGKPMDECKSLGAPNALFDSEIAGSSKKGSEETASTPGSDKVLVEKIVTPGPCNANPQDTTSATVSGIDQMTSHNLVKKEPEETPQQHILKGAEKAHLLERQSVVPASNCAESEMTDSPPQVPSRAGFDLNSEIFPNNGIHDGLNVATDNVPIPAESLLDITQAKTMPAVPEVEIDVKREESTNPVVAPVGGHSASLMEAKSLPSLSTVASPAVGLCESSSQPSVSTVCKPPARHVPVHADTTRRPCAANEACGALQGSSNPRAKSLLPNSRDNATIDGMSQGSAEMDCSDDEGNTVSRFPTTNKPHGESLGNGPTTKEDDINANNFCKELKKEQDSDMHEDCSSVTNKVNTQAVDGDKRIKTRVSVVSHAGEQGHRNEVFVTEKSKDKQSLNSGKNSPPTKTDNTMDDVKAATGSGSTDLQRPSALQKSTAPKLQPTRQSPKTSDMCLEKDRSSDIKSEMSPHGKQAASFNENHAKTAAVKMEHQTENEEVARHSDLQRRDSVLGKDSEVDGASSSQPHSECTKGKSAFEKLEHDKFQPDLCKTSPLQNERDGQLVGSHWRDLGHAYVNRNERWERFMESEREKNNGEWHGGRHASDMTNQRMTDHRGGWRGAGPRGHPRNFRGPRMRNEFADEPIGGRRRSFEDEPGHLNRVPHRRRRSPPPDSLMREVDIDGFHGREIPDHRLLAHGQIEDLPDDMMEDRFFMPRSHRHRGQGDHGFIQRDRSHSPAQRRGGHVHFHRGRSPEAMPRSPPLMRNERPYLSHCRHSRGHDERGGMQRNARRRGMEGDAFEPLLHPADLAELHAEEELTGRRKYTERRTYLRSSVSDEDEMLSYHTEDDMEFAEAGGGPREHDSRFRNRMAHDRARGEQEDGYRHRAHQGWRDGDSNDGRPKRRRY
ncbi:hypothetical protein SEVIR_9G451100v4 [Setaria viridis]|uniref:Uncharacterized protein n=1 Tax=Setaria viridis TaxID=4556 RepID=A0A4U6THI1_SETVI|nr:uncharacterized protein LOC117841074 [Setaria viridis]TKV96766.1 hypothetical protein SEVIR_9G451100v2 [Setaria viridis]